MAGDIDRLVCQAPITLPLLDTLAIGLYLSSLHIFRKRKAREIGAQQAGATSCSDDLELTW
jgi:hypothetical protein